ncbi:Hint domain-containing protein [Falsirhodobacter sp. 20TX0035]|uniref:Hint domain-containing protein n=1 Tax=Falsirhodobacter sp. 20TX0035 TaxID=3022019 RepID=UPI00232F08F7|nr:Hint domain-containing protein [Falsirhodobacter sp. 20TX0035]MDB6453331.1 Hint domain-containing protein [Falsirhodobacter sp. 20TX0035]
MATLDFIYLGNRGIANSDLIGNYGTSETPLLETGISPTTFGGPDTNSLSTGNALSYEVDGTTINSTVASIRRYNSELTLTDGSVQTVNLFIVQTAAGDLLVTPGGLTAPFFADGAGLVSIDVVTFSSNTGGLTGITPTQWACFVKGTLIETDRGKIPVEDLKVGDLVMTADHGLKPIQWVGSKKLDGFDLQATPNLHPIRIRQGALGDGLPTADLVVSQQHRILVRSKIAMRLFGASEALVAAKHLTLLEGIDVLDTVREVEYFHFLFDGHQIIFAEDTATESLYVGPMAKKGVGPEALEEIYALFPELRDYKDGVLPEPARPFVPKRMAIKIAEKHVEKNRALQSAA